MKKLVTLALAGICALAFASVADAGTVLRQNVINTTTSQESLQKESHFYANKVTGSVSSNWVSYYIYSNDITRCSTVMQNLINALNDPYSGLVASVLNEAATTGIFAIQTNQNTTWANNISVDMTQGYGKKKDFDGKNHSGQLLSGITIDWTDAADVAARIIPGRDAGVSNTGDNGGANQENIAGMEEEREDAIDEIIETGSQEIVSNLSSNTTSSVYYTVEDGQIVKHVDTNVVFNVEKTTIYTASANKRVSPLVLDITGNGVLQASNGQHMPGHPVVNNNVILADFYGDGFEVAMEWVGPQDGLLVAPKADGSVDMSCLFGTAGGYETGYEKLSLYDTNGDNKVNGAELNGLSVWQDANGNGIAEANEVKTVQELGITEIAVTPDSEFVSSFTMNGNTNKMWDWWPNALELIKVAAK